MRRLFRSSPSVLGAFLLARLPALIRLGFNPTLVRLGPWNSPMVVVRDTSFNPTLVRLRLAQNGWGEGPVCCFNPTLVRLRLVEVVEVKEVLPRFNPTLVRLRRDLLPVPEPARGPFQSHAGSIEAKSPDASRSTPTAVSIPRWFD